MNENLEKLIRDAQSGNKDSMMELVRKFNPLICKYKRLLNCDDGESSLTLAFLEIIHKIDLNGFVTEGNNFAILTYIKKAIVHEYYNISKKQCKIDKLRIEYNDEIEFVSDNNQAFVPLEFQSLLEILTPLQRSIINYKYFWGYSDVEIAGFLDISRQAVNRAKTRALERLRKAI